MKKLTFILIGFLLLLNSCSNELLENSATKSSDLNNSVKYTSYNVGDGLWDALGMGCDVTKNYASSNPNSIRFSVIDINKFNTYNPDRVVVSYPNITEYIENYAENAETYSNKISKSFTATATLPLFGSELSDAFSLAKSLSGKFDGKYIYASYDYTNIKKSIELNSTIDVLQNYLTQSFLNDLNTKTPQQIVSDYGTHVYTKIAVGAKLEIRFQSETNNTDRVNSAKAGAKISAKNIIGITVDNNYDSNLNTKNFNKTFSYRTRGGDTSKALSGNINLDSSTPTIDATNWIGSITLNNSVIVGVGNEGIVFIYDLISDPTKKAQIKSYVDQYLIDNKVNMEFNTVPIYQYYSSSVGDHLYAKSNVTPPAYAYEKVAWNAFTYQSPNTVPIYRYYNPGSGNHYYTKTSVTPSGYVSEGIEFYAYTTQVAGSVPIYRYYSSGIADHYYSKSSTTPASYVSEGIGFYAMP